MYPYRDDAEGPENINDQDNQNDEQKFEDNTLSNNFCPIAQPAFMNYYDMMRESPIKCPMMADQDYYTTDEDYNYNYYDEDYDNETDNDSYDPYYNSIDDDMYRGRKNRRRKRCRRRRKRPCQNFCPYWQWCR